MSNETYTIEFEGISDFLINCSESISESLEIKIIDNEVMCILIYGALLAFCKKGKNDEENISNTYTEILTKSMKFSLEKSNKIYTDIKSDLHKNKESIIRIIEQGQEIFKDFEDTIESLRYNIIDRILYSRQLLATK